MTYRRVSGLEEDLDNTEQKMVAAVGKLDKASTAADDSERAKKVMRGQRGWWCVCVCVWVGGCART